MTVWGLINNFFVDPSDEEVTAGAIFMLFIFAMTWLIGYGTYYWRKANHYTIKNLLRSEREEATERARAEFR